MRPFGGKTRVWRIKNNTFFRVFSLFHAFLNRKTLLGKNFQGLDLSEKNRA